MANSAPFREIVSYAIGGGWGSENPTDEDVPVSIIRGTDFASLQSGRIHHVPRRYEVKAKAEKRTLRPGDVVLEISGGSPTSGQSTGRTLLVSESILAELGGMVIPASFCRLVRFDGTKVDPRFAYYSLQDMWVSGRAAEYEHRSTGISNFQFEYFLDRETIRIAPLGEQRAVARILGALDDKIALNQQMNATQERMARALFKSWFVDFDPVRAKVDGRGSGLPKPIADLFPDRFEDSQLGEVPTGWHTTLLVNGLTELETGSRPKGGVSQFTAGIPSVGAESIVGLGLFDYSKTRFVPRAFFDAMARGRVRSRDVLLYKDGGRPGVFEPHVTMFGDGFPFATFAINEHVYRLRARRELGQSFLFFWLSSELALEEMRIKGTGVAIPGLNSTQVKSLPLLVPSSEVTGMFDLLIEPLVAKVLANAAQSRTLAAIRDGLLPKLISGELRVPEAERMLETAPT